MWYVDRGCGRAIGSSGNANELFEARFEDGASGFSGRPQNRAFRSNIDVLNPPSLPLVDVLFLFLHHQVLCP